MRRLFVGSRGGIAGTVYGTIVVMAALAAGSQDEVDPWRLGAIASATVLVLWIAHVYSHALAETIRANRRLDREEFFDVARRESAIPFAAVGPLAALVLGGLGVLGERASLRIALGIGAATLAVQGLGYARTIHASRLATIVSVAVNLSLGLVIVALEVALAH